MTLNEALARLKEMPTPVARTNDAAALWSVSPATASTMLARLAKVGHIRRLQRGVWQLNLTAHPWTLHPYLSDPSPSYLSLQTALFHHGMIEQIPSTIHVITTAKSRDLETSLGLYSFHQVAPAYFTGFEPLGSGPAQMATPEKALIDFFYFRPTKSRAFRALPELELPKGFRKRRAQDYVKLIASPSRRSMVESLISELW